MLSFVLRDVPRGIAHDPYMPVDEGAVAVYPQDAMSDTGKQLSHYLRSCDGQCNNLDPKCLNCRWT